MRICELRRFLHDFVVFVNTEKDIEFLKKDSRFHLHSTYTDNKTRQLIGCEFRFKETYKTLKDAKKFVEGVLKDECSKTKD